jgi:hypothetical protein
MMRLCHAEHVHELTTKPAGDDKRGDCDDRYQYGKSRATVFRL